MGTGRIPASLRRRVKQGARGVCEYCKFPQVVAGSPFHCDHAIPVAQDGPTTIENLVWSCPNCNGDKAHHATAIDPATSSHVDIFNPRKHKWAEHFRWSRDKLTIIGTTPVGRATVKLLRLNRTGSKVFRSAWIRAEIHPAMRPAKRRPLN